MSSTLSTKTIQLGDEAPDFTAETTEGKIHFHQWIGNCWCILFSHPQDFTPVCTTELGEVAKLKKEFDKRNIKVLSLSVDKIQDHRGWIKDINETQNTEVNFPMIADDEGKISALYGMIHPKASDTHTVRTVFVIDPKKKVRLTMTYPASTGRNFLEILRVVDSLQLTSACSVATPVNWKVGDDCVISPSITDTYELKSKFPKGWKELKPYLRLTPHPENPSGQKKGA